MSSDSDIEMKSALPKKSTKKLLKSPSDGILKKQETKRSTKEMVMEALKELHTRKGVSLYAIKKFITEKNDINTDKISYLIKKTIKNEVENGTIIQTKGIGASGSFKQAPKKTVKEKALKKKVASKTTDDTEKVKKTKKKDGEKVTKAEENPKIKKKKDESKKTLKKTSKTGDKKEKDVREKKKKEKKVIKDDDANKVQKKMAKVKQTPAKKRADMMKRKSIGSLLKPPKMKPKAR